MTNRVAFQEQVEAQLEEWSTEIERLKTEAKQLRPQTKVQIAYHEQLGALSAKQEAIRQNLQELKQAGSET